MKQKKMILLPDGSQMPALGQGTWKMGEDDSKAEAEIKGLIQGVQLGLNLIDSAEMYGEGKAELITGEAIKNLNRKNLYLVSKVYPHNACEKHIYSSLNRSLKLLGTDYLDMYLLHWRGDADLEEMVRCMEDLKGKGKIHRWGVSNFDLQDMKDLLAVPGGDQCCINQVLYNLGTRGIEFDLLGWQRERGIPFMAYSPVGQAGGLVTEEGVSKRALMEDENALFVAKKYGASVIQILLAFVLRLDDMVAIPKAVGSDHIAENAAVQDINLSEEDIRLLSQSFPPPTERIPMEKC
jgi:diketogulonate reductase-like aldo/keto reductase